MLGDSTISRRSFLGLGATAAVGTLAISALPGCAPSSSSQSSGKAQEELSLGTSTATSEVNVQDDSYTTCTTDYANLFKPLTIGTKQIKNRIMKAGATSRTVQQGAGFSDDFKNYYGRFAKGGAGLIFIDQFIDFTGKSPTGNTPLVTDEDAALIKSFTDYVHDQGALIGSQLWGLWSQCSCDGAITAPFENFLATRKMLSTDQIRAFQQDLVHRCVMLQKAGFDGVDINAGCDHTFASFLSRHWNTQRDDEYGPQSFENRARILTELIAGIKEACGKDFIVEILFNGVEENIEYLGNSDDCMKVEEAKEFAKLFEAAGADCLQIRYGAIGYHAGSFFTDVLHVCEHGNTGYGTAIDFDRHFGGMVNGSRDGACALLDLAAEIKKSVSIPVGTVGVMDPRLAPDLVDGALGEGKIDFIVLNRPLMCDPELPNKLQEGRRDEVAPCNHCLTCLQAVLPHPVTVGCRCNATFGRVRDGGIETSADPTSAEMPKNIMVVGGGPAGMEAARIAAMRGHAVTLYEEDGTLDGRMAFAAAVKGTHEKIADFCAYLERQLEVAGVSVETNTKIDAALVKEKNPDAVIFATGGIRPDLDVKGADASIVLSIEDAAAASDLGDKVVIVGDNHHAIDLAISLIKQNKAVTIVSPRTEEFFDVEHPSWIRYSMKAWLESKGAVILYEAKPTEVTETSMVVATTYGTTVEIACTSIVNCQAMNPNTALFDEVSKTFEAYNIGDAATFSTIAEAISSGNKVARAI